MPVAPLVGAWIEIKEIVGTDRVHRVAPLVGAWIEMKNMYMKNKVILVAPLVGAWIEMILYLCGNSADLRRSPRGSVD